MRPRVLFVFRGIKFKDQPETRRGGVEVVAAGELNYIVDTNQINLAYERLLNICVIDVCLIVNVGVVGGHLTASFPWVAQRAQRRRSEGEEVHPLARDSNYYTHKRAACRGLVVLNAGCIHKTKQQQQNIHIRTSIHTYIHIFNSIFTNNGISDRRGRVAAVIFMCGH